MKIKKEKINCLTILEKYGYTNCGQTIYKYNLEEREVKEMMRVVEVVKIKNIENRITSREFLD